MEALIANHQRRFWKTPSAYRSVLHDRAAGAALWKQASERRVHLAGCIRIPLRIPLRISLRVLGLAFTLTDTQATHAPNA